LVEIAVGSGTQVVAVEVIAEERIVVNNAIKDVKKCHNSQVMTMTVKIGVSGVGYPNKDPMNLNQVMRNTLLWKILVVETLMEVVVDGTFVVVGVIFVEHVET